jgi:hypothetical protein
MAVLEVKNMILIAKSRIGIKYSTFGGISLKSGLNRQHRNFALQTKHLINKNPLVTLRCYKTT